MFLGIIYKVIYIKWFVITNYIKNLLVIKSFTILLKSDKK